MSNCNRNKVTVTNTVTGQSTTLEMAEGTTLSQAVAAFKELGGGAGVAVMNPGQQPSNAGNTVIENGARISSTPTKVGGAKPSKKKTTRKGR